MLLKESFGAYGGARNGNTWSGGMSTADQATMVEISRQGYTGHTMLGFGGLIHMNGRVQDSVTGRFLSPDPYVTEPGHTQGYNRYAYVRNNPASFVDPSGYDLADLLQWLCNTSTGMCPPIAVPWELEEVVVSARRFVQDTQEVIRELLRQQQEGAVAQQAAGEVGGGSVGVGDAAEGTNNAESLDPCKAVLPGSGNAGQTVDSRVLQVRGEYGLALSRISGMPDDTTYAGVQFAQVLSNVNRLRPGGRWDTGEAGRANFLGNVLYGAIVRELGIPLWMANRVGDAAELYDDIRTGYSDGTYAPTDSPEARAQIQLGFFTCRGGT